MKKNCRHLSHITGYPNYVLLCIRLHIKIVIERYIILSTDLIGEGFSTYLVTWDELD